MELHDKGTYEVGRVGSVCAEAPALRRRMHQKASWPWGLVGLCPHYLLPFFLSVFFCASFSCDGAWIPAKVGLCGIVPAAEERGLL